MGCGASKQNNDQTADKKQEDDEVFTVEDELSETVLDKRKNQAAMRIQACQRRKDAQARMDARIKAYRPDTNDCANLAYSNNQVRT